MYYHTCPENNVNEGIKHTPQISFSVLLRTPVGGGLITLQKVRWAYFLSLHQQDSSPRVIGKNGYTK